jgi:hypothetical protein
MAGPFRSYLARRAIRLTPRQFAAAASQNGDNPKARFNVPTRRFEPLNNGSKMPPPGAINRCCCDTPCSLLWRTEEFHDYPTRA